MTSTNRLFVFKHFQKTLELSPNINGEEISGWALDQKMVQFTGTTETECKEWRLPYNRTRHVHRNEKDVETWISGTQDLNDYIKRIRPLTAGGLMKRLFFSPVISQYQPHNLQNNCHYEDRGSPVAKNMDSKCTAYEKEQKDHKENRRRIRCEYLKDKAHRNPKLNLRINI